MVLDRRVIPNQNCQGGPLKPEEHPSGRSKNPGKEPI